MRIYTDKKYCCGCGACASVCPSGAITMTADEEGFLYPVADDAKCTDCGLCLSVCPYRAAPEKHVPPEAHGFKHKDSDVLSKSSSGGCFTALSDAILRSGTVYGAALEGDFSVVHERAENTEKRNRFRGSKYCQSVTGDAFVNVAGDLEQGKRVLFTGTPCQIAGLLGYLKGHDVSLLVTMDFVCHGVPSPKLFREYTDFISDKKGSKLSKYFFRPKNLGWGHFEKAVFENGQSIQNTGLSDIWKHIFYSNNALRPSCYDCPFACGSRVSDITIGDFWGIEKVDPSFHDKAGVSFVLVNTPKGKELFEEILGDAAVMDCAPDSSKNPNLAHPTVKPRTRDAFWKCYADGGFQAVASRYGQYSARGLAKRAARKLLKK